MAMVHSINPCDSVLNRIKENVCGSRWGLGAGLIFASLAGAPMPLPQISLVGPILATVAAGRVGGRAAVALGFLSYLVLNRPSAPVAMAAGVLALFFGWMVPTVLQRIGAIEDDAQASAVSIDCEGFSALDKTYGRGAGDHAYRLLQQALEVEKSDSDLVFHCESRELVLVIERTNVAAASATMGRVERRFSGWLSDAGYECDLSVGLFGSVGSDEANRIPARPNQGPYLD